MIGIYKIINPKDKIYIGQTVNWDRRKKDYKILRCKGQIKLYNSFKKYGIENHIFEIIEECSVEDLNKKERYWQDFHNVLENGLNCRLTTSEDKSGFLSEETKLKMRGKKQSNDHKQKLGKSRKGKKRTEETKQKMINSSYIKGKKRTEETKQKISKTHLKLKITRFNKHLNKPIIQYNKQGIFIKEWINATEAAKNLNKASVAISECCNEKRKSAYGFVWKFKTN
jgi:group I intron endonuclease